MARDRLPPKPPKKNAPKGHQSPGAPELNISKEEILKLARRNWNVQEVADFFGCDRKTIQRRVSSQEFNAARHERGTQLLEATFLRAMGGRMERKREDGTIEVLYLKSSDRMMGLALKYYVGAPPQVIEINPDPDRPANVTSTVDKDVLKDAVKSAITELDTEY